MLSVSKNSWTGMMLGVFPTSIDSGPWEGTTSRLTILEETLGLDTSLTVSRLPDAADSRTLECSPGNRRCRTAQLRGKPQMAIPSQARQFTPAEKVCRLDGQEPSCGASWESEEGLPGRQTYSGPSEGLTSGRLKRRRYENPQGLNGSTGFQSHRPHHCMLLHELPDSP